MAVKDILREILINLRLDLTKNLEYDRLTRAILKKFLKNNHNCIDVGCHKGEILDLMLTYSPQGKHYAFEPIPRSEEHTSELQSRPHLVCRLLLEKKKKKKKIKKI